MEEHENLFEKIQEILGGTPGHLKVLEQQIDMDLQLAYYEHSKKMKESHSDEWALEHLQYLSEAGYSEDVKKDILARCASVESVACYRGIEAFLKDEAPQEGELHDWACLALNESRMHLESKILEENQVFISTGLGGQDDKLRYFVVLLSRDRSDLTETHRKVINNEFEYILAGYDAVLEQVDFSGYLASLLLLLPMQHSLKQVLEHAVAECNLYGEFLNEEFIVTNVKQLTFQEIRTFLEKKCKDKPESP